MRKKDLIRFTLITVLLVTSLVILHSSGQVQQKATSKESIDECSEKRDTRATPGMIWEPLSRQFFSFTSSSY